MRFFDFFIRSPLKDFFSIRGGTKLLYVHLLPRKNDRSRISYVGRVCYGPVRSAHFSCLCSNKISYFPHSTANSSSYAQEAQDWARPIFSMLCLCLYFSFFLSFSFISYFFFIFPITSIFFIFSLKFEI